MATTLGDYLASTRGQLKLTLRAAEEKTGVSNAYISQLESGQIQEPSPKKLESIADGYGVSYMLLMKLAGYRVPDHTTEVKTLRMQNQKLKSKIENAAEALSGGGA
jgi:transcriptional regulator with XRE-family HTH domain